MTRSIGRQQQQTHICNPCRYCCLHCYHRFPKTSAAWLNQRAIWLCHQAALLKYIPDVSKSLAFCSFTDNQSSFFFFFLDIFCSNSITIKHHFEDHKHYTPSEVRLRFSHFIGSEGTNSWCKICFTKQTWITCQVKRRKEAKLREAGLLWFHQKLPKVFYNHVVTHLTILQAWDPHLKSYQSWYSC